MLAQHDLKVAWSGCSAVRGSGGPAGDHRGRMLNRVIRRRTRSEDVLDSARGWVTVGAAFVAMVAVFGVAYSFGAFSRRWLQGSGSAAGRRRWSSRSPPAAGSCSVR
jgi:hypothetical protein